MRHIHPLKTALGMDLSSIKLSLTSKMVDTSAVSVWILVKTSVRKDLTAGPSVITMGAIVSFIREIQRMSSQVIPPTGIFIK